MPAESHCSTPRSTGRPLPGAFSSGFGLIELVIVIAIVAILAALALPSYQQTIKNNRSATEANDLLTALNTARTEAVTRSRFVSVCPSNQDASACSDDPTNWTTGWIVFSDDYTNFGTFEAATDTILRAWPPSSALQTGQDTLTAKLAGTDVTSVSFDRQGAPRINGAADPVYPTRADQITFTVRPASCPSGSLLMRTLTMATLGRATVETLPCP